MTSSGLKRGVAVTAITALASMGLPFAAMAQTVGESGTPLTLYSQYSLGASTGTDGANSTVTLMAGHPDSIGGDTVNSVRFSYGGGVIDQVVPTDGVATTEWAAPAGTHTITVEALDNGGAVLATDTQGPVVTNSTNPAVNFGNADFARAGEWDDAIVVRGTVANGGDTVDVSARGPEAVTGSNPADITSSGAVGSFVGLVDLGANDTADAEDDVLIGAQTVNLDAPGGSSDDVSVVTVYNQTVANVTRTLNPGSTTNVPAGSGAETKWTLNAVDQEGRTITGLNIYESNSGGAATPGNCGTPNAGQTNFGGNFVVTLDEDTMDTAGCDPTPPADQQQTTFYVADVNENGTYENGTDFLFNFVQTAFTQVATTVEISNSLGVVMDDDETSQVTLTVKDQNGNPIPNQGGVFYKIDRTGHDAPTGAEPAAGYTGPLTTNAQGQVTFALPAHGGQTEVVTISAYVNLDGNPNPSAGDAIATPFVVDTDETEALWDDNTNVQFPANTTQTVSGVLQQINTGKVLPNRELDIDYEEGTTPEANSILAPQAQQPAGTIRGSEDEAQVTTSATGTFAVALQDPASPVGQELNATVTVADAPVSVDVENTPVDLDVDWLRSVVPSKVTIFNEFTDTPDDGLESLIYGGTLVPGALGLGYVQAENSDGVVLTDVNVNLTIDEGHFVDIVNDPFDPDPVPGAPLDFGNAGKTFTVSTGDSGDGVFVTNMERHEGFDDDGLVDDNMSASAGSVSDVHDLTWTTNAVPINPRATSPLAVELSADQESSILPRARAGNPASYGQLVDFDVMTFDQFGNPTRQPTTTSDNTPLADFNSTGSSQFALGQPALSAFADQATSQTLEVELDGAVRTVYVDDPQTGEFDPANPGAVFFQESADIERMTDAIDWYDLDVAGSSFSMGQEGPERVPVGTTVTEVLSATDQEGQSLDGLCIGFLRGGPGDEDSDGNVFTATNQNGEAFYDFVGGSKGVARISAIAYENATGALCDGRIGTVATDTVTFSGGKVGFAAKLKGKNNGAKKDKLRANAPDIAEGATVRLFKIKKGGDKVLLRTKTANDLGNATFKVKDKNGKKKTKYRAKYGPTPDTRREKTNSKRVR